jgi:hypothetical protein
MLLKIWVVMKMKGRRILVMKVRIGVSRRRRRVVFIIFIFIIIIMVVRVLLLRMVIKRMMMMVICSGRIQTQTLIVFIFFQLFNRTTTLLLN